MHNKSSNDNRISTVFDGLRTKQTEKYATKYLTNSNTNARQTDELLGWLADFQCKSNTWTVYTAEKWQFESCLKKNLN